MQTVTDTESDASRKANYQRACVAPNRVVNGLPFRFERRRYGNLVYTWAFFYDTDKAGNPDFTDSWVGLGDPWHSVQVPMADLIAIAGNSIADAREVGAA